MNVKKIINREDIKNYHAKVIKFNLTNDLMYSINAEFLCWKPKTHYFLEHIFHPVNETAIITKFPILGFIEQVRPFCIKDLDFLLRSLNGKQRFLPEDYKKIKLIAKLNTYGIPINN